MDTDLAEKLHRQICRIESSSKEFPLTNNKHQCSVGYELSHKQMQNLKKTFEKYDTDKDKSVNFDELKFMLEKLGIPQTHLHLKQMIKQVDEDHDGKISFREFLLLFRKALAHNMEFDQDKSALLYRFYAMLLEIDVAKEGVIMAKNFFEAKIAAIKDSEKFHREILEEQNHRRRLEEEKTRRKLEFRNRLALFQTT
ncbi:unnamed protein product [Adineta ricciae]|uniref:EF-hand domain-containing protein n=1 Tax=Adineta ricciae TaxID=249248 RepID=A0A814LCW6_ADIRI|nr:unnamed protein product [Adineta ricciae]